MLGDVVHANRRANNVIEVLVFTNQSQTFFNEYMELSTHNDLITLVKARRLAFSECTWRRRNEAQLGGKPTTSYMSSCQPVKTS